MGRREARDGGDDPTWYVGVLMLWFILYGSLSGFIAFFVLGFDWIRGNWGFYCGR